MHAPFDFCEHLPQQLDRTLPDHQRSIAGYLRAVFTSRANSVALAIVFLVGGPSSYGYSQSPIVPQSSFLRAQDKPEIATTEKEGATNETTSSDKPPASAARIAKYRDQLILLRESFVPVYGQAGKNKVSLPRGTVLHVREVRPVDGKLFLVTMGGVIPADDVLLLEDAIETVTKEIQTHEATNKPDPEQYFFRGTIYHKQGEFAKAIDEFTQAIIHAGKPDVRFHVARAESRIELRKYGDAIADCNDALQIAPQSTEAQINLALVYYQRQKYAQATKTLDHVLQTTPNAAEAFLIRGWTSDAQGDTAAALKDFQTVLELNPISAPALNSIAWILATSPDDKIRDPAKALECGLAACQWNGFRNTQFLDTLAAAYGANNDFENAVKTEKSAIAHAAAHEQSDLRDRLSMYQAGRPFISAARSPKPTP